MGRQRTALGLVLGGSNVLRRAQRRQFGSDRFEIRVDGLVEQAALDAMQLFAACGKLPALEHCHLVGELLDLELLELQLAILAGQVGDQFGGEVAQLLRIHSVQLIVHLHGFDIATAKRSGTIVSGDANGCVGADATPWQANHQCLQFFGRDRQSCVRSRARPGEPSLVQPTRTEPDADAIMHQQLDPIRAPIGEQVGMMRTRFAEDANDVCQYGLRSGAHVQRRGCQPRRGRSGCRSRARESRAWTCFP